MKLLIAAALAALLPTTGLSAQVNAGDPDAVAKALTAMGYKPAPVTMMGETPIIKVALADFDTVVGFTDCTNGKQCKHLFLTSRFTDVKNPPMTWINKRNFEMDIAKVWVGEDQTTGFSISVPTGGEQVSPGMLRYVIDTWQNVIAYLSQSAQQDKLVN